MPKLIGFSRFAALAEEQISEKISRRILSGDQGMVVWWSHQSEPDPRLDSTRVRGREVTRVSTAAQAALPCE